MKKYLLMSLLLSAGAWANVMDDYQNFKSDFAKRTGLSFGLDISEVMQRVSPSGHKTSWQTQYYPYATWDLFQSDKWGQGTFNFAYTATRYWGTNANNLGSRIGVVSSINDYPSYENNFDELSYTHTFAGAWSPISLTVGQFPIYNFDGTNYDANQQVNFLNFALSQNASDAYPTAGVGAYVTITPNSIFNMSVGFQDAHNIDGTMIKTSRLGKKKYTTFASATFTPTLKNIGQSTYSILVYHQPSVPAQPMNTNGWSFNVQQNIGKKLAVFGRVNGASHSPEEITQSYVVGGVYNNPLNRNSLDQIGLAYALNKLNPAVVGNPCRKFENVVESFWTWGIGSMMTITPDAQVFINPGMDPDRHTAFSLGVRMTVLF